MKLRNLAAVSLLAGMALLGQVAGAQTVSQMLMTEDLTDPLSRTDWAKTLTFDKFDTLGGTRELVSVDISWFGEMVTEGSVTNNGQDTKSIRLRVDSDLTITGDNGMNELLSLSASDGPKDVAPGATIGFGPASDSQTGGPMNDPNLAFYVGPGTFNINGETLSGFSVIGGGGDATAVVATNLKFGAEVVYTFRPIRQEVPEPGTVALGAGLLVGAGALIRRRKK